MSNVNDDSATTRSTETITTVSGTLDNNNSQANTSIQPPSYDLIVKCANSNHDGKFN